MTMSIVTSLIECLLSAHLGPTASLYCLICSSWEPKQREDRNIIDKFQVMKLQLLEVKSINSFVYKMVSVGIKISLQVLSPESTHFSMIQPPLLSQVQFYLLVFTDSFQCRNISVSISSAGSLQCHSKQRKYSVVTCSLLHRGQKVNLKMTLLYKLGFDQSVLHFRPACRLVFTTHLTTLPWLGSCHISCLETLLTCLYLNLKHYLYIVVIFSNAPSHKS